MSTNLITRPKVPSWSRWRWGRAAQSRDQGEMSWEVRGIKWEVLQVRGLWGPGSSSCFPPSNHCSSSSHPGEQWATSTLELPCRCVVPQGRTVLRSFQSRPPQVQPRKRGMETSASMCQRHEQEELKSTVHANQTRSAQSHRTHPLTPGQEPVWRWCHQHPPHSSAWPNLTDLASYPAPPIHTHTHTMHTNTPSFWKHPSPLSHAHEQRYSSHHLSKKSLSGLLDLTPGFTVSRPRFYF